MNLYFPISCLVMHFQPPQSFLNTMEEYIREAPRMVTVPNEPLVSIFLVTFHTKNWAVLRRILFVYFRDFLFDNVDNVLNTRLFVITP